MYNKIKNVGKVAALGLYALATVGCTVNDAYVKNNVNTSNSLENKVQIEQIMDVYQLGKQKLNLSYSAVDDYISAFKTEIERKELNLDAEKQFKLFVDYTSNSKDSYMVVSNEHKRITKKESGKKLVVRPEYILKKGYGERFEKLNNDQKWFMHFNYISNNNSNLNLLRSEKMTDDIYGYIKSELAENNNYLNTRKLPNNCSAKKDINKLIHFQKLSNVFSTIEKECNKYYRTTDEIKKILDSNLNNTDLCNESKKNYQESKQRYKNYFKNNKNSCFDQDIINKIENYNKRR